MATVPSSSGRSMHAAVEDVQGTISNDVLSVRIMEMNDQLDGTLESMVDAEVHNDGKPPDKSPKVSHSKCFDHDGETIANDAITDSQHAAPGTTLMSVTSSKRDRIEVYWPHDDQYYPCTESDINDAGRHIINYDDDDIATLNSTNEFCRLCKNLSANSIYDYMLSFDA